MRFSFIKFDAGSATTKSNSHVERRSIIQSPVAIRTGLTRWSVSILTIALLVLSVGNTQSQKTEKNLPQISLHRGASQYAPENTLAAFSKAIKLGADFIEIDIRTTSDGVQVIMHDASLKRTTGLDAAVDKTSLKEIKQLSAGKEYSQKVSKEKVPTLEEVCRLVSKENQSQKKQVKLYVDCKSILPEDVISTLGEYGLLDSAVFYGDPGTLANLKRINNSVRLLPAFPGNDRWDEAEKMIASLQPYAFDVSFKDVDEALVSKLHARGIKVFSDILWSNDKPENYQRAIDADLDVIQTDNIKSVLKIFEDESKK